MIANHRLAALDDEEAALSVLVGDGVDKVRVQEEARVVLHVRCGAVEVTNADWVVGDFATQLANVAGELSLAGLLNAYKEDILHAAVVVTPHVFLWLTAQSTRITMGSSTRWEGCNKPPLHANMPSSSVPRLRLLYLTVRLLPSLRVQ
eukprot:4247670-Prymnesium_polylepis.1